MSAESRLFTNARSREQVAGRHGRNGGQGLFLNTKNWRGFLKMHNEYSEVIVRLLRADERFIESNEQDMPLVLEAKGDETVPFLQQFLAKNSKKILEDTAKYGALLLRGFAIASDEDFEKTILSIQGVRGISDAFMSEEGRIHPDKLKFVLHTNAVYKTGGTLYLGGFHSENYYSPDVPSYIGFCCLTPSIRGGETGLINMEKVYEQLRVDLKNRLENNTFFVSKWRVSEVSSRYKISAGDVVNIARSFGLPILGEDNNQFILMYKPSVFVHPQSNKKSLQINFFELKKLNAAMRKCFLNDYKGKAWFWHRVVWRLPEPILKIIEFFYIIVASFSYSPRDSLKIALSKFRSFTASKKINQLPEFNQVKVESCFNKEDIKSLAQLMREYYSSCLWQKGDILLVDNRKVVHAGMPGAGPRLVRAMIGNPLQMKYAFLNSGVIECQESPHDSIGSYVSSGEECLHFVTNLNNG